MGKSLAINLSDPSHWVLISNQYELDQVSAWCEGNGLLPPYLGEKPATLIACSPLGGLWTHRLKENVKYFSFNDFLEASQE